MDIKQEVFPAKVRPKRVNRSGSTTLTEGQDIRISIGDRGRIDAEVPPGKIWEIQFNLELTEKDA